MTETAPLPFRRPDLPLAERVEDLLTRLTTTEKIAMLHQHQPAIDRLGVARFSTGTEALHGLSWLGEATVFPQAIGLATSWDPDLLRRVGAAVGDEVRARHHDDPARCGLNVWAPVVNPLRDPRWGRNEEGYAEDPLLTGLAGEAYARGLAGDHPQVLRTAPTLKHFLGYNNETQRCRTSSSLRPRVLREYELPAYRPAIERGSAVAVMAAYNLVNGRPAHVTPYLENDLRTWTGDEIFVVSDAYAPSNLANPQEQAWFADHAESHAAALRAGIDSFTDADDRSQVTIDRINEALDRGLIKDEDVDRAVRRALTVRVRLGEFDPAGSHPYAGLSTEVINCPAHRELAHEAARASITLLKSEAGLLPLDSARHRTVAVIGTHAAANFTDWYSGTLPYARTAFDGLTELLGGDRVRHAEGVDRVALRLGDRYLAADTDGVRLAAEPAAFDVFDWGHGVVTLRSTVSGKFLRVTDENRLVADSAGPADWVVREMFRFDPGPDGTVALRTHHSPDNADLGVLTAALELGVDAAGFTLETLVDGAAQAAGLAATADAVVLVLGNHPMVNGRETEDRADLELSPAQDRLIRAVHAANPDTALVLVSSYPYAVRWAAEHLPAVLWMSHGGQELGTALAEVLTGLADPAGRLTQTWYRSAAELPDLLDYDIISTDTTYQYYRGKPLFPFGHGLSYTTFEYTGLELSQPSAAPGDTVAVTVQVTNTGSRPGQDVVQLYTRQQVSRVKQPVRLRDYAKVSLAPGESRPVTLTVVVDELRFWDVTSRQFVVETARHDILVGRSATDVRAAGTLTVHGTRIAPRRALDHPVDLRDHDEQHGITLVATGGIGDLSAGESVRAVHDGAWCLLAGIDLTGVRTVTVAGDGPELALRLDDPSAGMQIAVVSPGEPALLAAPAGVHDLYLVLPAGARLSTITFRS